MTQNPQEDAKPTEEPRKPYEAPKLRSYGNIQQITKAGDGGKLDSPGGHKTVL